MKKTLLLFLVVLFGGLGFTASASAQDVSCSDIVWSETALEVNPNIADFCLEVVEKRGTYCGYESCLSLPDTERKRIKRPDFIKVKNKGLDNRENELTATNAYAALLTHEIDHLNGILFIDYEHAGLDT